MPIGIGAATIGAAGLGAAASLAGSSKQAKAANNAAQVQQNMYDTTRSDLAPYREAGLAALPAYQKLLGIGSDGTVDAAAQQAALEATPGYQFTLGQGTKALTNNLSARGLIGGSGAFSKGLARFVTGLADQTYQQQLGNYQTAAGMGQSAANQTGVFGTQAAQNIGNNLVNAGNAQAAGLVGAGTQAGNALTNAAWAPYYQQAFQGMYAGAPSSVSGAKGTPFYDDGTGNWG